jgi:hypothetical protein
MSKRPYIVNASTIAVLTIFFAVFDASLTLGNFSGLVFSLYLLYGSIALFVFNMIAAGILAKRKKEYLSVLISGILFPVIGAIIAYVGGRLF